MRWCDCASLKYARSFSNDRLSLYFQVETVVMIESSQESNPEVVGAEFGGKWIAWDDANLHIVASGETADAVKQQALTAGVREPTLEFVPPSDAAFAGGL
jgi:hypothetical protein